MSVIQGDSVGPFGLSPCWPSSLKIIMRFPHPQGEKVPSGGCKKSGLDDVIFLILN